MKTHVHTYKGFTGGISDLHLDDTGKHLASASLDRYVRIHDAESTVLQYQCYVKSKATRVLIRQLSEHQLQQQPSDDEEEVEEGVKARKNNKRQAKAAPRDSEYDDMFDQMPTVG